MKRAAAVCLDAFGPAADVGTATPASLAALVGLAIRQLKGASSTDVAHELADASFWHPTGYLKIQLAAAGDDRLRLHYWPGETHDDPHDHRWNYLSSVLCGTLTERVYEKGAGAEVFIEHSYESDGLRATFESSGHPTRLRVVTEEQLGPGSIGRQSHDRVHSISTHLPAISVMLTLAPRSPRSSVFLRPADSRLRASRPATPEDLEVVVQIVEGLNVL